MYVLALEGAPSPALQSQMMSMDWLEVKRNLLKLVTYLATVSTRYGMKISAEKTNFTANNKEQIRTRSNSRATQRTAALARLGPIWQDGNICLKVKLEHLMLLYCPSFYMQTKPGQQNCRGRSKQFQDQWWGVSRCVSESGRVTALNLSIWLLGLLVLGNNHKVVYNEWTSRCHVRIIQ